MSVYEITAGLPDEMEFEMKFELEKDVKPKMDPIHKLSVSELAEMIKKISELLPNGYIRTIISTWIGTALFIKKKDDGSATVLQK